MFKNYKLVTEHIKFFFPYTKPFIGKQAVILLILFLFSIVNLIQPLINKYAIDVFFKTPTIRVFVNLTAYILIVFAISKVLTFLQQYYVTYVSSYLSLNLRKKLISKLVNMEHSEINKVNVGDLFISFDMDIGTIQNVYTNTLVNYVLNFFTLILSIFFMLKLSWIFLLATLITVPFTLINNRIWFNPLKNIGKESREKTGIVFDYVQSIINNLPHIQKISKNHFFKFQFLKRYDKFIGVTFKSLKINLFFGAINDFILNIEQMFLFGVAGYLVYRHQLTIGGFVALSTYASMFKGNLSTFVNFDINMTDLVVSSERLQKFLNIKQVEIKDKVSLKNIETLNITEMNFEYIEGYPVLENINLDLKNGNKITIIGESGGGKSTLISLISGLYLNDNIKVNGLNIHSINTKDYRKNISIMSQESFIFEGSLRDNLTLGTRYSNADIFYACKLSAINDFVDEKGLDFHIENNGRNLSGGQKQRIALARLLLQKPKFVILDEITSGLDKATEKEILKNIYTELKDSTIISITHRDENLKYADRIYKIENKKMIEINKNTSEKTQ